MRGYDRYYTLFYGKGTEPEFWLMRAIFVKCIVFPLLVASLMDLEVF